LPVSQHKIRHLAQFARLLRLNAPLHEKHTDLEFAIIKTADRFIGKNPAAFFLGCHGGGRSKYFGMKLTKNIGMLLLGVYLIIDGLLGFGLNLGPFIFLLYLVALVAGVLILLGK
jgi:hypothetical protein